MNEAARAEQARQDALAAAQVEAIRARTQVEASQAVAATRVELDRQRRADQEQRRSQARHLRRARWASLRGWAATHVVDLLIYPLAIVSAVMAVPAMAEFGYHVYGDAAGYALPVITELGMWAFAFAVHITRQWTERDGVDRPVWALQLGVWSFATVAAGLNFLHGVVGDVLGGAVPPVVAGVVMAVASVAGVMAHQLVTAAPRRSRGEREASRIERQAAVKVSRVRRAAVRSAVAEIDPEGSARLLFTPGHYRLTRSRFTPWRPVRLDSITLPGQSVTPALDDGWDDLDRELADLLATVDPHPHTLPRLATDDTRPTNGGGIGTLDRDSDRAGDQHESTPIPDCDDTPPAPAKRSRVARTSSPKRSRKSGQQSARSARSIEELRAALHAAIEANPGSIDPASAESIRRALRCSPARARELRDTYRANQHPDHG